MVKVTSRSFVGMTGHVNDTGVKTFNTIVERYGDFLTNRDDERKSADFVRWGDPRPIENGENKTRLPSSAKSLALFDSAPHTIAISAVSAGESPFQTQI